MGPAPSWRRAAVLLLGAVAVVTATPMDASSQFASQLVVSGLSRPVAFVQHPTRDDVQLIVEQGGRIRVLQDDALAGSFLDLTTLVSSSGERGLLGLAFAPDFETSLRAFVCFTNLAGNTVIARYRQTSDAVLSLEPSTRFDLGWPGGDRFIVQPFSNHNGGHLAFGPDGYLYVGLGDGGSGNDPMHLAQNPATVLGKMLRLDVSVADTDIEGYDVPAGNPFVGVAGVLPEIWAFGLRNPWRYSFDDPERGGSGALVIGDVGQGAWEEVDYEPAGQGGRNYGWRNREGAHDNDGGLPPAFLPLADPIFEYSHTEGRSITGGIVYRGTALGPANRGRYFYGDFITSRIWSVALTIGPGGEATASNVVEHTAELRAGASSPASFAVDASGELFVVNYSGSVHRVVSTMPRDLTQMVVNGDFSEGLGPDGMPIGWTRYSMPTRDDIVTGTEGGWLSFLRPPGSTQAGVLQHTGVPLAAGTHIQAAFEIGNSDAARKRISVMIHDEDARDLTVCTLDLEPQQPLRGYVMRTRTMEAWTGATISFQAETTGTGGFYLLDNVTMRQGPDPEAGPPTRRRPVEHAVCARMAVRREP